MLDDDTIPLGAQVFSRDGVALGEVQEVTDSAVVIGRDFGPLVHVPFDLFAKARSGRLLLLLDAADLREPGRRSRLTVPAMTRFNGGDRVYTSDGMLLGTVTETRGDLFKLDVPLAVDYWLRTDEVVKVERGSVLMNFSEAELTDHRMEAGAV